MSAKELLEMLKENNLLSVDYPSEPKELELDDLIDYVKEYDLDIDCLKSNYKNEFTESLSSIFESMVNLDENSQEFQENLDMFEMLTEESMTADALTRKKKYHNKYGKLVGNTYKPINQKRKNFTTDISILNLGTKKFYDYPPNDKHWKNLFDDAMGSADPIKGLRLIRSALVNLMVNFKNKHKELGNTARRIWDRISKFEKSKKYLDALKKNQVKRAINKSRANVTGAN